MFLGVYLFIISESVLAVSVENLRGEGENTGEKRKKY